MKIVTLIKQVPDTWGERKLDTATGLLDRAASDRILDDIGERALEAALTVKDSDKSTEVVALTMGPDAAGEAIRKALSMGADSGVHVVSDDLAGSDLLRTAQALAAALREGGFDLVVAGNESTDGRGGVIPAMVAELLGVPAALGLDELTITGEGVRGVRRTEVGEFTVEAPLPAVVSVTEKTPEPRFPNIKGIMTAKRKPVASHSAADLGLAAPTAASRVVATAERPARGAGTVVTDDGTAVTQLIDYLAANRLI
ncbi:MAG: electron transfer flavoprotein subunit beta/FixA family protein [Protaetiibacter sp.]